MPRKYKRKEGTRARVCSRTSEDLQSAINQTNFFIEKDNDDTINLSNKNATHLKLYLDQVSLKRQNFHSPTNDD